MRAAPAVASPPFSLMPFTTSSQAGSLRLETTALAPCAAICSQIERPMPRLPPVTTATLPARSNIIERLLVIGPDLSGGAAAQTNPHAPPPRTGPSRSLFPAPVPPPPPPPPPHRSC